MLKKIAIPVSSTVLHKYYPIIQFFPKKLVDIITIGKVSECMIQLQREGYNVQHANEKIDLSAYELGLYTSEKWDWIDGTKRPRKKILIDHASLNATNEDFDFEIVLSSKLAQGGNPNCQTIYTGLYQFINEHLNLYINNRKILRDKFITAFDFKNPELPFVVCFTAIMDDQDEMIEPFIELSRKTNLLVKTYAWHEKLNTELKKANVKTIGMRNFISIDPRLAADCFLTSYSTTALITAVILGQKIQIYHTTRDFDIGRTNRYYERGEFQHKLFPRCRAIEKHFSSTNVTQMDELTQKITDIPHSTSYIKKLKQYQIDTYGDYHIANAPKMTAMEVLSVFRKGKFTNLLS